MTRLRPGEYTAMFAEKLLVKSTIAAILCAGSVVCARAQDTQPKNTADSWTATTEISVDSAHQFQSTESHDKSASGTVDTLTVQDLGPNGQYLPDYETDTETVQVNATTTRIVKRDYKWDVNGQKSLVRETEETRTAAGGDAQLVRTISNSDSEGNLQVTQREVGDTKETSPNTQETKTTLSLQGVNGSLNPALRTEEVQDQSAGQTVEVTKTTLAPDSSGNWQAGEKEESTSKVEGKDRTSEDRVSIADSEGRFTEVSRTVGKQAEPAAGEQTSSVETYTTELPGLTPNDSLHLSRQVTTRQESNAAGTTTYRVVGQPDLDNPNAGLQPSMETTDTVHYSVSGTQETKTIQTRDINGTFNAAYVETRTSDQTPPEPPPAAGSNKSH